MTDVVRLQPRGRGASPLDQRTFHQITRSKTWETQLNLLSASGYNNNRLQTQQWEMRFSETDRSKKVVGAILSCWMGSNYQQRIKTRASICFLSFIHLPLNNDQMHEQCHPVGGIHLSVCVCVCYHHKMSGSCWLPECRAAMWYREPRTLVRVSAPPSWFPSEKEKPDAGTTGSLQVWGEKEDDLL